MQLPPEVQPEAQLRSLMQTPFVHNQVALPMLQAWAELFVKAAVVPMPANCLSPRVEAVLASTG
jgi:hypothetical protein